MNDEITLQAKNLVNELFEKANLKKGDIFVVGCSSSEIIGSNPGTNSNPEVAAAVLKGIYPIIKAKGVYIAAQCCEHLNRAVVLEREAAEKYFIEQVNVIPQPKAGGSFATALYKTLKEPVVVEEVSAHAGIDIGGVLIGMQIKRVAVPVALKENKIGMAHVTAARTRPKFVGGERAVYNTNLL